ncbi:hypothetical protein B9Z55_026633 [Caenorhabditis nigoni]|nr:hypothetical protein B9Z55_026633 [Caenorhabditis nigoni]
MYFFEDLIFRVSSSYGFFIILGRILVDWSILEAENACSLLQKLFQQQNPDDVSNSDDSDSDEEIPKKKTQQQEPALQEEDFADADGDETSEEGNFQSRKARTRSISQLPSSPKST